MTRNGDEKILLTNLVAMRGGSCAAMLASATSGTVTRAEWLVAALGPRFELSPVTLPPSLDGILDAFSGVSTDGRRLAVLFPSARIASREKTPFDLTLLPSSAECIITLLHLGPPRLTTIEDACRLIQDASTYRALPLFSEDLPALRLAAKGRKFVFGSALAWSDGAVFSAWNGLGTLVAVVNVAPGVKCS